MNQDTEQLGLEAAIKYEQQAGRAATRVQKCGYDLSSSGGGEERHIEVKATSKSYFTTRWLEEKEQQCAVNDPKYFLYLVTDVTGSQPRVFEYGRTELGELFSKVEHHYIYKFRRSDFK